MSKSYTLQSDSYPPETMIMARMARYMQSLTKMLGAQNAVDFRMLESGGSRVVATVDDRFAQQTVPRLERTESGGDTPKVANAQTAINSHLVVGSAYRFIHEDDSEMARVIAFPETATPHREIIGPIEEEYTLDGKLILVEEAGETAHLQLQYGQKKHTGIQTDPQTASNIAKHMYEYIRIFGTGQWLMDGDGNCLLLSFRATSYKVMEKIGINDAFNRLRAVEGSGWKKMDDPIGAVMSLRDKDDEPT